VATTSYSRLVGGDRRARLAQDAELERQQQDRPEHRAGVASTAMTWAASSATTSAQPIGSTLSR
jgi:hypothetical protein